ncbi:MAG: cAMP-binding protein [Leptospiraceae bacterium]|nr:MAG: cAMP-binding protein [Leptospiraceae bacterium]
MDQNTKTQNIKILQPNEAISQQTFEPQSVIIKENTKISQLILIHNGEIAYFDPNKKQYLFVLPVKNYIPAFSYIFSTENFPFRVITTKPSIISAFPVSSNKGIQNVILGKLNIGLMALNSLDKETHQAFVFYKKLLEFYKIINKYVVNLSIGFYKFQPNIINNLNENEEIIDKNLLKIKEIIENFEEHSQIPKFLTKNWFLQNNFIEEINREYDYDNQIFEHLFLKKLISLPIPLQSNIYNTNLKLMEDVAKKYQFIQSQIFKEIEFLIHYIQQNIDLVIKGDYSLFEKFSILVDLFESQEIEVSSKEFYETILYLKETFDQIYYTYQKVFFKKLSIPQQYTKIKSKLEKLKNQFEEEKKEKTIITVKSDNQAIFEDIKDSAEKILDYCEISSEEKKRVLTSLQELRKSSNPLESEPDIRRLRKPVNEVFWKAYENAFLKYRNARGNVPKYISLFLNYGFFDEKFLEQEHLIELYNLVDTTDLTNKEFSVMNAIEWLNYIYEKKELPSINEFGQTYFEILKLENPQIKVKKIEQFPPEVDTPEKRIQYEIRNFISNNSKLVSGSPTTYFAGLTKFHITAQNLSDLFVTKEKISNELQKLLDIDFSAFYREMVLNDEKRKIFKEFIMVNVFPHLILLPSIGNRSMMWQELEDPRKKDTPARFTFPIFCTGDLFNLIVESTGAFRWEIQKTILGHDYNNVGMPSLTSEYIDYIQFYQKNRDLSDEQKEKIKQDFKNLRDDRSKFVHDYLIWIKYESQGILKLNRVVRNIMYRYVPFAKGIRENLQKQPAFVEIHNRFKNIRNKKLTELENRWKKYGDKETWPQSLKLTYDYYNL